MFRHNASFHGAFREVTLHPRGEFLLGKAGNLCLEPKGPGSALPAPEVQRIAAASITASLLLEQADIIDESDLISDLSLYVDLATRLPRDHRNEDSLRDLASNVTADVEAFAAEYGLTLPSSVTEESLLRLSPDIQHGWLSAPLSRVHEFADWIARNPPITSFNEPPILKARVAADELPPVVDRLPTNPLVVEPVEGVGHYGGTLREVRPTELNGDPYQWVFEYPFGYAPDTFQIVPNVVRGWDWSDDGTTFTMYLRQRMKWSDGAPFVADDLIFYWNDILLNDQLSPITQAGVAFSGNVGEIEKLGDAAVQIRWEAPGLAFVEMMARWQSPNYASAAYLRQFHPIHTDIAIVEREMRQRGFSTWSDQFKALSDPADNPDTPVVGPWQLERIDSSGVRIFSRNPYYWKVDTSGNQLPYIDVIESRDVQPGWNGLLSVLSGESDFMGLGDWSRAADPQAVREFVESAGYRTIDHWWPETMDPPVRLGERPIGDYEFGIVTRKLGNVPEPVLAGFAYDNPGQFYFKR